MNNWRKNLISLVGSVAFSGIMLLIIESMCRSSVLTTVKWVTDNPISFTANLIVYCAFFGLFLSIFPHYRVASLWFAVTGITLTVVNIYKKYYLDTNLYPWDVRSMKQVLNLLPQIYITSDLKYLALVVILLISAVLVARKNKLENRVGVLPRISVAIVSITIIASIIFYRIAPMKYIFAALLKNYSWDQNVNYERNGFGLAFLINVNSAILVTPTGYNKKNVYAAFNEISSLSPKASKLDSADGKPDIIVILSESFWDPSSLRTISFKPDPIPFFRNISNKFTTGTVISPTINGLTCNVEFELLTGFSTVFLPKGSIPYQQYLSERIPSLPNVLAKHGYNTITVHPYHKWFWNRDTVYKYLGINEFIGVEEFAGATKSGPYVSDLAVAEKIINVIGRKRTNPVFLLAITMQNHGPYDPSRYENEKRGAFNIGGTVSASSVEVLNTYFQGLNEFDRSVSKIVSYLEQTRKSTILVVLGDHLPFLGNKGIIYREGHVIENADSSDWTLVEKLKMRSTPLVIWSNYGITRETLSFINTSYLPAYLLAHTGIRLPAFYNFLNAARTKYPAFTKEVKVDANHQLADFTDDHTDLLYKYRLIQYDILFGKKYAERFFD